MPRCRRCRSRSSCRSSSARWAARPFEVFRDIDTRAYAAASIAQVHRARLADGTPVVLKVRRPGVRDTIEADLRLLRRISELIETEIPEARRYRPAEIAAQFARSLEREVDFATETRNIQRFAQNFAGDPHIVIPRVFPEWTSEVLLVQEHVEGAPATDPAAVAAAGLDRKVLAARGVDVFLKMILVDGLFHADPHPGNVFYLPGNRIVVIDFGMVGRLSPQRRRAGDRPPRGARAHGGGADARGAARLGRRRATSTRRGSPRT